MPLEPLKQWICEACNEVIESPDQGWLEWLLVPQDRKYSGFRIVHNDGYSPRKPKGSCYAYDNPPAGKLRLDGHLDDMIGENGRRAMPFLLSFIDDGQHYDSKYSGPKVENLRDWTEFARRLTIPYYEEARLLMDTAAEDGFL